MTQEFENMLYLFGCGALGKEPENKWLTEIRKIRAKALEQQVWTVVYGAIRKKLSSNEIFSQSASENCENK